MNTSSITASWRLIQNSNVVFLSTLDADGTPDTRAVFNLRKARSDAFTLGAARLPDGFQTWIATNTSSRKVRELRADPRSSLYYVDTASFEGLTLQGELREILDDSIRHAIWVDGWNIFYPGGVDGGDFSIFQFHPLRARYYHGLNVAEFDPTKALGESH